MRRCKNKLELELYRAHDFCASGKPVLTVVMVHGIASDSGAFGKALSHLEADKGMEDVRFVAFDLIGSGKSLKGDALEYDYNEQLTALHHSITKLRVNTPLILVGHSMGTLIVTRYANTYKKGVDKLVLISPPIYKEEDLDDPAFLTGMRIFRDAVSVKNRKILEEKSFNNSMEKIVADRDNYKNLVSVKIPTVLIYGKKDRFIASHNIPGVLKENAKYLTGIKTEGLHGVSSDKYNVLEDILEEELEELSKNSKGKK